MAALRSATWPSHQRLEKRLDVRSRFTSLEGYRAHLERMWGFCAPLEQSLQAHIFGAALPDYESRRKLPLLTQDLSALGLTEDAIASLTQCRSLPHPEDPASAFGCIYVLEGATLGGRTLLPLVENRLGFNARHGAAFLASYGDAVAAKWQAFRNALDAWCGEAQRRSRATQGAVMTFDALTEWLCGRPR